MRLCFDLFFPGTCFDPKLTKHHLSSKYWRSEWDWEQILTMTEFGKTGGQSDTLDRVILTMYNVHCTSLVFWSVYLAVFHIRRRPANKWCWWDACTHNEEKIFNNHKERDRFFQEYVTDLFVSLQWRSSRLPCYVFCTCMLTYNK